jgi:uncharacterized membrane protein
MWLSGPEGKKSVSLTLLVITTAVCLIKLVFAGAEIGAFKMAEFSGTDFAAIVGVFAGLYWGRRQTDAKSVEKKDE